MRPKMSPILQQNNNNNYPCLSAGPGHLPHKCSLPLPFSARPELSLTGLPLIRGLRAWALCSRSRQRAGGSLAQAPLSPPRPAEVHLSAEWGLPLGAGIGALVATLQTSEGSGRTQTQCLFLRTDRGPTLHTSTPQPGGMLRGWLRGKTGGPPALPAHIGANRTRERSGRRWRKPANHTVNREKAHFRKHQHTESVITGQTRGHPAEESTDLNCDLYKNQPKQESREDPREDPRTREETKKESRGDPRKDTRTREESRTRGETRAKEGTREESRQDPRKDSRTREESRNRKESRAREEHSEDSRKQSKTREEGSEESREDPRTRKGSRTREKSREETRAGSGVREQTEEQLEKYQSCSCRDKGHASCRDRGHVSYRDRGHVLSEAQDSSDGVCDTDLLSPACMLPFSPAEGGNCKATSPEADPLMTSVCTLGIISTSSPGELWRNHREEHQENRTDPSAKLQREYPSLESYREHPGIGSEIEHPDMTSYRKHPDPSLEREHPDTSSERERPDTSSERARPDMSSESEHPDTSSESERPDTSSESEHPDTSSERECPDSSSERERPNMTREHLLEELEFGGFMQAPAACGQECSSSPWSNSGVARTNSLWDQPTGSWAVFPPDRTDSRDQGGQWWPLHSEETTYNPVCVFTTAFPTPPAWSSADPRAATVPTLTQLLRGRVGPEESSPEQGLLDTFHDLNKMIVQRYKQEASGVSRELLQRGLGLGPPHTQAGAGPGKRRISPGPTSSHLGLL